MGLLLKFASLACACSALTVKASDVTDLPAVDELLRKGIQKVEDDTADSLQRVLTDMIKAEWDDKEHNWKRKETIEGLRFACLAMFFDDDCYYGL